MPDPTVASDLPVNRPANVSKRRDAKGTNSCTTADRRQATSQELGIKKGRSHRPSQTCINSRGQINENRRRRATQSGQNRWPPAAVSRRIS